MGALTARLLSRASSTAMTFGEKEALTTLLIRASSWSLCGESCAPSRSSVRQEQAQTRSARLAAHSDVNGAMDGGVRGVHGSWVVVPARGVACADTPAELSKKREMSMLDGSRPPLAVLHHHATPHTAH